MEQIYAVLGCARRPSCDLHMLYGLRKDLFPLIWEYFKYDDCLDWSKRSVQSVGWVGMDAWPQGSADININMMPFICDKQYLPESLHAYLDIIEEMVDILEQGTDPVDDDIYYLTIQKSWVGPNESQRRPGVHTEAPGCLLLGSKILMDPSWGGGRYVSGCIGGIVMVSSVANSCRVWNCEVRPEKHSMVVGKHGSLEHLRDMLDRGSEEPDGLDYWEGEGQSYTMEEDRIYWMTDRTPHESLPLKKGHHRQYVRVVAPQVSVWYAAHSTENPLGVVPDPTITEIVYENKFTL